MNLSAPTQVVWWIAVVAGILGILGAYVVPALATYATILLVVGFVLLVLGTLLKGL